MMSKREAQTLCQQNRHMGVFTAVLALIDLALTDYTESLITSDPAQCAQLQGRIQALRSLRRTLTNEAPAPAESLNGGY